MPIQKIKATKTASLTDFRDPMKVIKAAGDSTVAIMNRNKVVGYFVPESQTKAEFSYLDEDTFDELLPKVIKKAKPVLEYLKDK